MNITTTNAIDFGPVTCDSFMIYYLGDTGQGNFSWAVDAGGVTTVTANSGTVDPRSVTLSAGVLGAGCWVLTRCTSPR
jgi:hypothetical protein